MRLAIAIVLSTSMFLAGCGGPVRDDVLAGPCRLAGIDEVESTTLCRTTGDNSVSCNLLPDGTAFAAGYDGKYIAVAMHPDLRKRAETRYFYLVRDPKTENDEFGGEHVARFGPCDEKQFAAEKKLRGLPGFSIVYEELK